MTNDTRERPGVAQTLTVMFDNQPRWGDLYWLVDKAREAGVKPQEDLLLEYGEDDYRDGPIGISLINHPDTSA